MLKTNVSEFIELDTVTSLEVTVYDTRVEGGFKSPSVDYQEGKLDLNTYLIKNPPATFYVRASGDSMVNAGIYPGSLLVVDRSLDPKSGKIVIVALDGDLMVKRLRRVKNSISLLSENPKYLPLIVSEGRAFKIWGVVTAVVNEV